MCLPNHQAVVCNQVVNSIEGQRALLAESARLLILWQLLDVCLTAVMQAQDIMLGLLEYQAVSSDSRLAGSSLVAKQSRKAADTPSSPIQHVKPPQVFQPGP